MGECLIIRSGGGTDTSSATATPDVVVNGHTCYVNDELVVGNIPVKHVSRELSTSEQIELSYGYYEGNDLISTSNLADETVSDAVSSNILTLYKGYVNGVLVNGDMANHGAISQSLAANGSYTIPTGWHDGSGKVTQTLSTQGAANVTPGTANKTACAASKWTTGDLVVVGDSNLVAGNIKNGVNIFGVTGTYTGWVDNNYVPSEYIVNTANGVVESWSGSAKNKYFAWGISYANLNKFILFFSKVNYGWKATLPPAYHSYDQWADYNVGMNVNFSTDGAAVSTSAYNYSTSGAITVSGTLTKQFPSNKTLVNMDQSAYYNWTLWVYQGYKGLNWSAFSVQQNTITFVK